MGIDTQQHMFLILSFNNIGSIRDVFTNVKAYIPYLIIRSIVNG